MLGKMEMGDIERRRGSTIRLWDVNDCDHLHFMEGLLQQ